MFFYKNIYDYQTLNTLKPLFKRYNLKLQEVRIGSDLNNLNNSFNMIFYKNNNLYNEYIQTPHDTNLDKLVDIIIEFFEIKHPEYIF